MALPSNNCRNVLTFVMTIEYNGFAYAGFQRQTSTPRNNATAKTNYTDAFDHGSPINKFNKRPIESTRVLKAPITIQQQIEDALQKWTNLSVATLRVRGAGRTDKGVHASGQVVAFDIPLCSLSSPGVPDALHDPTSQRVREEGYNEVISSHALPLLQGAYHTYCRGTENGSPKDHASTPCTFLDFWQIRRAISTRLPSDIVIRTVWMWTGPYPFEARKGISCKTYVYNLRFRSLSRVEYQEELGISENMHPICNAGPHLLRRVCDQNNVWLSPWPLDPTILHPACQAFVGLHDFTNFIHKEDRKKESECNIGTLCSEKTHKIDLVRFDIDLQKEKLEGSSDPSIPLVYNAAFTLSAKGFRRQMIRNLVGFVVDVARGVRFLEDIPKLLQPKTISPAVLKGTCDAVNYSVNAAPACGLHLDKVVYVQDRNHFL
ncbi:hypothetical protein HJC23_009251 [Cyclotella cryptica]|uniref:tRNA pseudouridine synthase n=1 Tax=Cyclotella cryptica TaxID=29204 RepID=A0ABD3Q5Y5_9STRA|eukprot:CCRYP_008521-RA/>CCRYP_008521-RA protein AED:0.00 eAED:0.00 QI:80/-1/1/1/-1/1/1/549/432